ncbi:serine/threonine protein kinase [Phormidium pseudopriestleyi FRX01]|uniref:non-specific serine/threonine protein kinase n=1 Tax=Phormidium pseudopriestleyi FRX01 TaxID=1759528 RepID=A0ABS3FP52_9CYAN|nr:serine/threonine protein kinase [Phormidium pseudopriestleyi FRX01]
MNVPPTRSPPLPLDPLTVIPFVERSPLGVILKKLMQPAFLHCINPDCPSPTGQSRDYHFCDSCGTPLILNRRYLPLQKLGTGGFAVTFTVYDRQRDRERVLKVLVERSPKALELFKQEASVLASLTHPGIPKVDRDGYFHVSLKHPQPHTLPCLVMEKIEGLTLDEMLHRDYPQGFPEEIVVDWLLQAADILEELHRHSIIHRDLKPTNLMVRMGGTPTNTGTPFSLFNRRIPGSVAGQLVAIDFGGVKQLSGKQASSTRLFSPGYSPPEQMMGASVGPAADFYALGRTAIFLLTGRSPTDLDDGMSGECRWHPHARVSRNLAHVIDEMLEFQVDKRLDSAAQLQRRLIQGSYLKTLVRQRNLGLGGRLAGFAAVASARSLQFCWGVGTLVIKAIATLGVVSYKTLEGILRTTLGVISWVFTACFDTLLGTILGGLGASVGTGVGFALAYWLPVGSRLSNRLSELIAQWFPNLAVTVDPVAILFGMAGVGTALGLTEAGSFGQKRRFVTSGMMGLFGYGLGWFVLAVSSTTKAVAAADVVGFTAIAIASIVLGLGLPKPQLFHATMSAIGTAIVMAVFLYSSDFPLILDLFSATSGIGIPQFWDSIAFFALLGMTGSFCLGCSYYLLMPVLRLLGFR